MKQAASGDDVDSEELIPLKKNLADPLIVFFEKTFRRQQTFDPNCGKILQKHLPKIQPDQRHQGINGNI